MSYKQYYISRRGKKNLIIGGNINIMLFIILNIFILSTRSVFAFLSQGLDYIDFACLEKIFVLRSILGVRFHLKGLLICRLLLDVSEFQDCLIKSWINMSVKLVLKNLHLVLQTGFVDWILNVLGVSSNSFLYNWFGPSNTTFNILK